MHCARFRRAPLMLGALIALMRTEARAQAVQLQIRPHVGDTLHLRLDQQTELTGTRPGASSVTTITTTMRIFSVAGSNSTRYEFRP